MKRWLFVLILVLSARQGFAQSHPDVVAQVKAELQAKGADLSGACGGFAITKRVAWKLRDEGAGVLDKPAGNNCDGRAVDILIYPGGRIFDILTDAGGSNGASWQPGDPVDAARWRAVLTDPDGGAGQPPSTPPGPVSTVDLRPVLERLAAAEGGLLNRIAEAEGDLVRRADKTDEKIDALGTSILAAVDNPGWLQRFFSNRAVQAGLAAVGSILVTRQMMQPAKVPAVTP